MKIPQFKTIREEAKFWDTHDVTNYLEELKSVSVHYIPESDKNELITIRVPISLKTKIDKIARKHAMSSSTLIRAWMVEKVRGNTPLTAKA